MIKRPVESGWGGDAVVCADSVGSDWGGSGEPAQYDSVHRLVDLGLERSRVRLIVEHEVGGLSDKPKVSSRNRKGAPEPNDIKIDDWN